MGAHHDGFGGFVLLVMTPVRLKEDGVDLGGIDGFGAVANGFDQGTDAEVFDGSEGAFAAACDEVEGGFGEGAVRQTDLVELAFDELDKGVGTEPLEGGGVGHSAPDVVVDAEVEGGVEGGLAEKNEVVILGEVFEQEA